MPRTAKKTSWPKSFGDLFGLTEADKIWILLAFVILMAGILVAAFFYETMPDSDVSGMTEPQRVQRMG